MKNKQQYKPTFFSDPLHNIFSFNDSVDYYIIIRHLSTSALHFTSANHLTIFPVTFSPSTLNNLWSLHCYLPYTKYRYYYIYLDILLYTLHYQAFLLLVLTYYNPSDFYMFMQHFSIFRPLASHNDVTACQTAAYGSCHLEDDRLAHAFKYTRIFRFCKRKNLRFQEFLRRFSSYPVHRTPAYDGSGHYGSLQPPSGSPHRIHGTIHRSLQIHPLAIFHH